MAPIVPEVLGLGFFANLGDTHHFFQPWLNDRNGRGSVFYPSFLSRIFGRRKKRSSGFNGMDIISPQEINSVLNGIERCKTEGWNCQKIYPTGIQSPYITRKYNENGVSNFSSRNRPTMCKKSEYICMEKSIYK